jgi:hypothetical protein
VPVQREEVRVERKRIIDAIREEAYAGPDITEAEHEVTLHAERPVVGEVRKERIEAELPNEGRRATSPSEPHRPDRVAEGSPAGGPAAQAR